MTRGRNPVAGLTLIEVMVGLLIFALIGAAAFLMLDQILQSRRKGDLRLDRIVAVQRGFRLLELDLQTVADGSLRLAGNEIALRRHVGSGEVAVTYVLEDRTFWRVVTFNPLGKAQRQSLIPGVQTVKWATFSSKAGWAAGLPSDGSMTALDLQLTFADEAGTIHRTLTVTAPPPGAAP